MQLSLFSKSAAPEKKKSFITKEELNESQYEAVTTTEGPVLVIAGAGSGKTRTLVYRTAHLVEKGVTPESILLLTFTRKASQEMVVRASQIIDESCRRVTGGTFHAVASLLLRRYGHHLGYAANFTIIDQSDAEGIVNLLKSSLNFGGIGKKFPSKRVIISLFSSSVNKTMPLSQMIADRYTHIQEFTGELLELHEHYKSFKMEHNLMDYDDLLVNLQKVLHQQKVVRQEVYNRFQYIMVDEYQDTNRIQADIVRLIAGERQNVMAVGDDSQSIYSFRGADFRNIMEYPTIFSGTKVIRLEENYRSTQPILSMTNAIIDKAAEKYTKKLFSNIPGEQKPIVYAAKNETDQARYIVQKIQELYKQGTGYDEIAVLFRSGFHSYKLEMELTSHQIVFEKRGGMKLTESAHIKDVICYLRVISNPEDNLSWNRILLQLEKVGPKTAQKILDSIKGVENPIESLKLYPAGKSWKSGYDALFSMLSSVCGDGQTPLDKFELVMEYYRPIFERVYHDDYPTRSKDLEQIRSIISGYADLQSFIEDTALDPPETDIDPEEGEAEKPLILSTVHSSKGLEWKAVFIINLVEGKFPSGLARLREEVEEERRLLYVAATRAKELLFMIYPREVMSPERYTEPAVISRFMEEIPGSLTVAPVVNTSQGGFIYKKTSVIKRKKSVKTGDIDVGVKVNHAFFGEGAVQEKVGPRTVQILFTRHGLKTINLDYAKLEVVG